MNQFGPNQQPIVISRDEAVERSFITRVYTWMTIALVVTGLVATATASNVELATVLMTTPGLFMILMIVQIGVVVALSAAIRKLSAGVATGLFIGYAALTGLTFSTLFLRFTAESIGSVFFITAGTFAVVSLYGYTTKTDLTKVGSLALMALIGLIIASLVNLFLQSSALYWIVSFAGVIIFVALIAYDTQRIKMMAYGLANAGMGADEQQVEAVHTKASVLGALALYLDFINLFLFLLRILGNRR
jgi:hypothetical protein